MMACGMTQWALAAAARVTLRIKMKSRPSVLPRLT
jgi:hypothetical protein